MHNQIIVANAVSPVIALAEGLAAKRSMAVTEPCEAVAYSETMIDVDHSGDSGASGRSCRLDKSQ